MQASLAVLLFFMNRVTSCWVGNAPPLSEHSLGIGMRDVLHVGLAQPVLEWLAIPYVRQEELECPGRSPTKPGGHLAICLVSHVRA